MEEAPENGKESKHSAHANGMNEIYIYIKTRQLQCNIKYIKYSHTQIYILLDYIRL